MSLNRPPPRIPPPTRHAARNREEQRRFELMTVSWCLEQLNAACTKLGLAQQGQSKDEMQMALVSIQAHHLDSDEMTQDPVTGALVWPDPHGLFPS